jgi:hypothetical protein
MHIPSPSTLCFVPSRSPKPAYRAAGLAHTACFFYNYLRLSLPTGNLLFLPIRPRFLQRYIFNIRMLHP